MEIRIGNESPTFTAMLHYYKNILYREPVTGQFPIIHYKFEQVKELEKQFLTVKVIGFEKSLLQDKNEEPTYLECKFHDILEYIATEEHIYRYLDNGTYTDFETFYAGKGEINLNEEINEIGSLNVVKIIISFDKYLIKPTIDCTLTKKEELYYRHLYYNEFNPFEGVENPYDKNTWRMPHEWHYLSLLRTRKKYLNSIHNNQSISRNEIEFWIGDEYYTIIPNSFSNPDFFSLEMRRDPETNQFPTFRYKFKLSQRYRYYKVKILGNYLLPYEQFLCHPTKIEENMQYSEGEGEFFLNEIFNADTKICILSLELLTQMIVSKRFYFLNRKCFICKKYIDSELLTNKKIIILYCTRSNHEEHACHEKCIQKRYPYLDRCLFCFLVNELCCICLNNFVLNTDIKYLSCNHIFHTNCINYWLKNKSTCPYCKQENH